MKIEATTKKERWANQYTFLSQEGQSFPVGETIYYVTCQRCKRLVRMNELHYCLRPFPTSLYIMEFNF